MSQFLLYYQRPEPATWVYLSSFLTIGLYFVFHRFWSVRNLDILLLILLAPGILMVHEGRKQRMGLPPVDGASGSLAEFSGRPQNNSVSSELAADNSAENSGELSAGGGDAAVATERDPEAIAPDAIAPSDAKQFTSLQAAAEIEPGAEPERQAGGRLELSGFLWLFAVELVILVRLFLDPMMVRRPLLDPNLTTGGLVFIGVSMLIFLMANVITSTPRMQSEQGPQLGPGYPVLNMLPAIPTIPDRGEPGDAPNAAVDELSSGDAGTQPVAYAAVARTLAILAHLAVVVGITLVGHTHFGNFKAGVGCATLYLMLPYTAQMTGRVDHVLPAALLVWAILMYRRPVISGICLGLASGLVYYPAFLLPLWLGFYRQRGFARFAGGVAVTILVLTVLLSLGGSEKFSERLIQMYGLWLPLHENLEGVWGLGWSPIWRFPVLVAFGLLAVLYAIWPRQKNLGTLMSCSAAVMVAAQFWHGFGGGLFVAWFLPLMLLTIFRPNLEDRVALKVIGGGSTQRLIGGRPEVDAA